MRNHPIPLCFLLCERSGHKNKNLYWLIYGVFGNHSGARHRSKLAQNDVWGIRVFLHFILPFLRFVDTCIHDEFSKTINYHTYPFYSYVTVKMNLCCSNVEWRQPTVIETWASTSKLCFFILHSSLQLRASHNLRMKCTEPKNSAVKRCGLRTTVMRWVISFRCKATRTFCRYNATRVEKVTNIYFSKMWRLVIRDTYRDG